MQAWIDPDWQETDGISIVFADTPEEAANLLGLDCAYADDEVEASYACQAESYAPADGMQDIPLESMYTYLSIMGHFNLEPCPGCYGYIGEGVDANLGKDGTPLGYREFTDEYHQETVISPASRPHHAEGIGLFCSWGCWESWAVRQ